MLQIYNSATKTKQEFKPIEKGKVSLYVCGMTVYDYCHIGHARVLVGFDVISRYLRFRGYDVNYVRNITDVDDKIIARANENGETIDALTERFIGAMHEDAQVLKVLPPDQEPRATHYIENIIDMIKVLLDKDHAYVADNGDVYYKVASFENYGALAHKNLDDLVAGARVEITDAKHNPLDFVLWKMAKPEEPSWDSPWGPGRPGWHIECSAMSTNALGNHFDIHGGGFDLKFPHHENEIAQSEAATGESFVNYWMHVGFVTINKEKMSKSLGNFFTIREVLEKYHPEVIRYFMISSHYRSPINYSQESLNIAHGAIQRFYTALRDLHIEDAEKDSDYEKRFNAAMDDDFNTPEALAVLFDMTHEINSLKDSDHASASKIGAILRRLATTLGILDMEPDAYLQATNKVDDELAEKIDSLIEMREQARSNKDWATADKVRDELDALGVILEDGANGTSWRVKD